MRLLSALTSAALVTAPSPAVTAQAVPAQDQAQVQAQANAAVAAPRRGEVWGYYPWWMRDTWKQIDLSLWDRIVFFDLEIGAQGEVLSKGWPGQWKDLDEAASRCGIPVDLAFTLFDKQKFEALFSEPARWQRLAQEMMRHATQGRGHGVHLDVELYEALSSQSVQGFRAFVRQLHRALGAARKSPGATPLSVFGLVGAEVALLDRDTLRLMDRVVVQAYDFHWDASPTAGPVAPLRGTRAPTWSSALQQYVNLGVARERMVFGTPYFGYEWPVAGDQARARARGKAKRMSFAPMDVTKMPDMLLSAQGQSARHGVKRDPVSGSPYYTYRDSEGQAWQGWYDDATSLGEKFSFIQAQKIGGIAAFAIGYDRGAFDALIVRHFGARERCDAPSRRPGQ